MTTDIDTGGIRVNMTEEEAKSQDREPLPVGKYHFKITDMSVESVSNPTSKNQGKPYINFEFTVQDGVYRARKAWTNAMCFDGALYTISQILKALGRDVSPSGGFEIPTAREFYIGKDIWGRMGTQKKKDGSLDKDEAGVPRVQLRGFSKYEGGESTSAAAPAKIEKASASVLP